MKTLRERVEETLRDRGYDLYAVDDEAFQELLDALENDAILWMVDYVKGSKT